jgi:hypothetical protein
MRRTAVAPPSEHANLYIAFADNDLIEDSNFMAGPSPVFAVAALAMALAFSTGGSPVQADEVKPAALTGSLAGLPGLWTGQGRLGFKDGKAETVTCRATYFAATDAPGLKQTIRCASPSGKIELKSRLEEKDGALSGEWSEEMYNLKGALQGKVTERGLVVTVKGDDLNANMDVIVKDDRQIVEIQFHNTSLIGITLVLKRASAGGES